ncbi:MAG: hypothetical protein KGI49_00875 [Patescibacteria group bacterium]|nr:hypothetical protein [Patescibacteria group bacterium]
MPQCDEYNHVQAGFGATVAILASAMGAMAFSIAAFSAAADYSDSVQRGESRIQASLNAVSCLDMAPLVFAKDPFVIGKTVELADLGCTLTIGSIVAGKIKAEAQTSLAGVGSHISGEVLALP